MLKNTPIPPNFTKSKNYGLQKCRSEKRRESGGGWTPWKGGGGMARWGGMKKSGGGSDPAGHYAISD